MSADMSYGLFERYVREGELTLVDATGERHSFGHGSPSVTWRMKAAGTLPRILKNPAYELGQTYMEGGWDVADGSLADLLRLLRQNLAKAVLRHSALAPLARIVQSWNNIKTSFSNVARHYDLDEALFRAFLDRDMHYSCAYFRRPDVSLECAQQDKCRLIAAKLALHEGQHVLDVGSGWGALAFHLAREHGVRVTGLTLSKEQLRVATAEADARGLADRVTFKLEDYRAHAPSAQGAGRYDRIVSVGMFEHVGRHFYETYFRKFAELLTNDGCALLHTIGSTAPPSPINPWIRRYIFPGGYIPALSEVGDAIERSGLIVTDLEILRDHYALTLAEWNRRFQAQRARFVASKGEAFCRMWEFYLITSQTAFECRDLVVQQWQLGNHATALPVTRDYLYRSCD